MENETVDEKDLCSRLASRVEELEKLIAKHSGSLNSADSASVSTSDQAATETR
jgi:hypothetical protein